MLVSSELTQCPRMLAFLSPMSPTLLRSLSGQPDTLHHQVALWESFPSHPRPDIHSHHPQAPTASLERSSHRRCVQHRSVPQPNSSPNCQGKGWWTHLQQLAANQRVVNMNVLLCFGIFFSSLGISPRMSQRPDCPSPVDSSVASSASWPY